MNNKGNVAKEISSMHFQWAGWLLGILLMIYAIFKWGILPIYLGGETFFHFAYEPARIFSLVIGIISGGTMFSPFVRLGTTRKSTYAGNIIAAFTITACLAITISIISAAESFLLGSGGFPEPWALAILTLFVHIFINYMAGWMITAGYLRFGGIGMTVFILTALAITIFSDGLLNIDADTSPSFLPDTLAYRGIIAIFAGSVLLAVLIWIGRRTTAHMPIKIK
ncbi:hypothetical protein [Salimicrobium halophilum]|uniref:Uncharacterized protein n=1 Tax=Salimicrobium halophilum TaxID=86666 RepID=A0A1G8TSZ9_9BACI|nr:hypothetical protein [Salimicrobium halophilum]SDJ44055.1 hypothetical protein SAMN04490247_1923 [Salimicrobium halophilum]